MHNRIPLPSAELKFDDIFDYLQKMKEMKMKKPLYEAQTKEAQGKALESQIMASLYNAAFPGQQMPDQNGQPGGSNAGVAQPNQLNQPNQPNQSTQPNQPYVLTDEEKQKMSQMQPGDSFVVGQGQPQSNPQSVDNGGLTNNMQPQQQSASGKTSQQRARELLYALGKLKETPQEQEARENRMAYQQELGKSDVKALEKWNDTITTSHQIMPVLENIQDISTNPVFQEMYKNPQYFGYDLQLLKRFGKPEEIKLLTDLGTNSKSIFQSMGQEFKGAFREFEMNLFNKAAPDEINDTLPQIIAKTQTMMQLRSLAIQRLTLADNIVRSAGGKISPGSALEIADKQINGKAVRKQIEDRFKASELEQKYAREKLALRQKSEGDQSGQANVIILVDPNGGEHEVAADKEAAAMAKYPNLKRKKM